MLYIFDADGTLRRCKDPKQPCPNRESEWELIPGVKERLSQIDWKHNQFAIASNQGGVALGYLSEQTASLMLYSLAETLREQLGMSPEFEFCIEMCPCGPRDGCPCRKPEPGMLQRACLRFDVQPSGALMIGDMESDRQAAEKAGVPFQWAWEFFGWPTPA